MKKAEIINKGWGYEKIWASNDLYAAKLLHFNSGAKFSMHFHAVKDETWYVMSGKFKLITIYTHNAMQMERELNVGDIWHNPPLLPHQLICLEEGDIMEVSTQDVSTDNYRVAAGDSQS